MCFNDAKKALSMIDAFIAKYKADLTEMGSIPSLQDFALEMNYRVSWGMPKELATIIVDRYSMLNE